MHPENNCGAYFHVPYLTSSLISLGSPPVAASIIKNKVVMRPNTKIADAKTVRVGKLEGIGKGYGALRGIFHVESTNLFIKGAIRMEPMTCMAWLSPVSAPSLPKVLADLNRSVARVTMEPLKLRRELFQEGYDLLSEYIRLETESILERER